MRKLVIGDIHGNAKGLNQVLKRCNFNPNNDQIIQLGDVADGWSETAQCVDILLDIKEKSKHKPIFIRGNHDVWVYDWFKYGIQPIIWLQQGGKATRDNYVNTAKLVEMNHINFWNDQIDWYIDENNNLFIHAGWYYQAGFPQGAKAKVNAGSIARECHWDRGLYETAKSAHFLRKHNDKAFKKFEALEQFNEIYIGHTSQTNKCNNQYLNLWNCDSGSGWNGRLSIMDINTKEKWYADLSKELYPDEKGRN
jgi:serine/threonine protein phosphatase 1